MKLEIPHSYMTGSVCFVAHRILSGRGAIHEVIPPFGNILKTDIAICHKK